MSTKRSSGKETSKQAAARARRDALIEEYQRYVHSLVGKFIHAMGLPIDLQDEYISAGYLGLVEAAERYNPESGVDFRNYAYLRIRGAVIDSIRSSTNLSGKAYRMMKALEAANHIRAQEVESSGQHSKEENLAKVLEFASKGALAYRLSLVDAEEEVSTLSAEYGDPEQELVQKQEQQKFSNLVATLPEKERLIISEYYFKGKSFSEIAQSYEGMSKSWVSRLHTRALDLLKERYLESSGSAA